MAKYKCSTTGQFRRDIKLCIKQDRNMDLLEKVINLLAEDGRLPQEYHPHKLSGRLSGIWECHIQPDWLLLWAQDDQALVLIMTRTGTHAEVLR